MRVKVPTADLIEIVERRRTAALKSHEKALAKYEAKRKAALPKVVAALRGAALELEASGEADGVKLNTYRERGIEIEVETDIKLTDEPRPETASLTYALKALQRTSDKTVSLTPEELAWYTDEPE